MEMKKTARTALLSALFTALLAPAAFAEGTMKIDLQTALDKAFATHADIKKAEYSLDAARADYNAARESFGPRVSFSHSFNRGGYWEDHPVTNYQGDLVGYSKNLRTSDSNSFSLSVPIFNPSLMASEKRAKAGYQSKVLGEELAFIQLKQTVSSAYYTLLAAIDSQHVCEQSVAALQDHLKNVQAQYDVGVVAKVDLLRSEVELTSAQQDLIKAENRHSIAEARLNNMMGIAQDTRLSPKEELKYLVYEETLPNCINHAMLHRLDLQQSRLQVKAAEAALNVAKAGWMPSVSGQLSNSWSDNKWPGNKDSNWGAGVGVSMNVFDSGVTKSNVASAKANLMTAKESYRQDTDNVELDVRNCYNTLREAEKRISTTQVAVSKAEEDYHIAQVRYEAGVGTNTDVLDAQVALVQARNNFNSSLYDYNLAKVALDTAMGIEARPSDYKYLTYGERYKATKAVYNEAVKATDSDKVLKDTVKALEEARKERRKIAWAEKKKTE